MPLSHTLLLAGLAASSALGSRPQRQQYRFNSQAGTTTPSAVNTTTCNGKFYAYTELAGYGLIPGTARDKFGDTIGGIGSAIALDQSSWALSEDGRTYTGLLWAMPDRGW